MRSPFILLFFTVLIAVLATGCYSFSTVRYPGLPAKRIPADGIQIGAERDHFVVFGSFETNSGPFTVVPEESLLRDSAGRHYRLVFESPSRPESMKNVLWYEVHAYGPLPSRELYLLAGGQYDLSLAYTVDGRRTTAQKQFVIERHSVPFFVAWTAWLFGMH